MRTIAVVLMVFAVGVSGAVVTGAGLADVWGTQPPQTSAAQEQLEESANETNPNNEPIQGPVSSGDSSLAGIIVDGGTTFIQIAGAVVLFPLTLVNLGFPAWFAVPVGSLAELIAGIGVIQAITGRRWR